MHLSIRDVALLLGVSDNTVHHWIERGQMPAYRLGQQFRFNRTELLEWAMTQHVSLAAGNFFDAEFGEGTARFSDLLRAGGVYYGIKGKDKREVFESVMKALRLPADIDKGGLLAMLMARERLGSTVIGNGIAVPHARRPIILRADSSAVFLCFLERAIDFDSSHGQPVHTLFFVISPTFRVHLLLLSQLASALGDPQVLKTILARETEATIFKALRQQEETVLKKSEAHGR